MGERTITITDQQYNTLTLLVAKQMVWADQQYLSVPYDSDEAESWNRSSRYYRELMETLVEGAPK